VSWLTITGALIVPAVLPAGFAVRFIHARTMPPCTFLGCGEGALASSTLGMSCRGWRLAELPLRGAKMLLIGVAAFGTCSASLERTVGTMPPTPRAGLHGAVLICATTAATPAQIHTRHDPTFEVGRSACRSPSRGNVTEVISSRASHIFALRGSPG